jgi:hypothetical protein
VLIFKFLVGVDWPLSGIMCTGRTKIDCVIASTIVVI